MSKEALTLALVRKVHKAKGRYHTQLAMCDLYDAVGLPNFRPGEEPVQAEQEPVAWRYGFQCAPHEDFWYRYSTDRVGVEAVHGIRGKDFDPDAICTEEPLYLKGTP